MFMNNDLTPKEETKPKKAKAKVKKPKKVKAEKTKLYKYKLNSDAMVDGSIVRAGEIIETPVKRSGSAFESVK